MDLGTRYSTIEPFASIFFCNVKQSWSSQYRTPFIIFKYRVISNPSVHNLFSQMIVGVLAVFWIFFHYYIWEMCPVNATLPEMLWRYDGCLYCQSILFWHGLYFSENLQYIREFYVLILEKMPLPKM